MLLGGRGKQRPMKPFTEERTAVHSLQSKMGQKMAPSYIWEQHGWGGEMVGQSEVNSVNAVESSFVPVHPCSWSGSRYIFL